MSKVSKKGNKIKFDDEGNEVDWTEDSKKPKTAMKSLYKSYDEDGNALGVRWYQEYSQHNTDEVQELKAHELTELSNKCQRAFEAELTNLQKKNPSDAKWLQTALHKGTSKDRANSGALLVQSNPLANLDNLETLIGLTKMSNKSNLEILPTITELFTNALLPSERKLLSIGHRGGDAKRLRNDTNITESSKDKVLSYWHYENQLRDLYFDFLKNLQTIIQSGQDSNKGKALMCAARLLAYAPEKEQMLLSMLINKFGDPSTKIASKALHHLTEVAHQHPNMSGVIVKEAEKLLFRNNISERAQHFALCFLAQVAQYGDSAVCKKMVQICFSFFKLIVNKGAVNSKTMQAILSCLKRSVRDLKGSDSDDLLTKEIQDTMYRLVHLANIQISLQTLSLLLQLVISRSMSPDRFYNAFYKKLSDMDVSNVGNNSASLFLHILHRAIHHDSNVPRAQAFIKRVLQSALYYPAQVACGCLIVVTKLLRTRTELNNRVNVETHSKGQTLLDDQKLADDDDDDEEEKYLDVPEEDNINGKEVISVESKPVIGSWVHNKSTIKMDANKASRINSCSYDAYNRIPAYSGAQYALRTELLAFAKHFHPTLRVIAENVVEDKPLTYYGDPLKDFSLAQFLDRFSFRNPKKMEQDQATSFAKAIHHKQYVAQGSRSQPIQNLTTQNVSEEERFIFEYLTRKRNVPVPTKEDDEESVGSVDDDEFEAYLDGMTGTEDDLDFLADLDSGIKTSEAKSRKNKKEKDDADIDGDEDWDFNDDNEDADDGSAGEEDSDNQSVSLDGSDDEDGGDSSGNEIDDDFDEPKSKKMKPMGNKQFTKMLKGELNTDSLFAAVEDFADMMDDTGKSKSHGTIDDVFNKDKSSDKQMSWEQKRQKDTKGRPNKFGGKKSGKHSGKPKFGSKKKKSF